MITVAAGLRLSVPLAILGAVLNTALTIALIVLDQTIARVPLEYALDHAAMWIILVAGAGSVATLSAWRTRSLALRGALESVRLERAQRNLEALLRGHHDAHSLVSSLTLTAGLLQRGVKGDVELANLAGHLRDDLSVLRSCVRHLRESAEGELTISLEPAPVDLAREVPRIVERARYWLGSVDVDVRLLERSAPGLVAGGEAGLARVLVNLLKNACKGDGRTGARSIRIAVSSAAAGGQELLVEDDGPGLPDGQPPGVGLSIVRGIAGASGGELELEPAYGGGLAARVRFPAPASI